VQLIRNWKSVIVEIRKLKVTLTDARMWIVWNLQRQALVGVAGASKCYARETRLEKRQWGTSGRREAAASHMTRPFNPGRVWGLQTSTRQLEDAFSPWILNAGNDNHQLANRELRTPKIDSRLEGTCSGSSRIPPWLTNRKSLRLTAA
jgi:hypothetical protein